MQMKNMLLCAQLRENGKQTFTNYDGKAFTECEIVVKLCLLVRAVF